MIRMLISGFLCMFLYMPIYAVSSPQESESLNPVQVVNMFQKLPPYEMFCENENRGSAEPIKVGEKFNIYLSNQFYKLFLWSQCGEPEVPPHYKGREFTGVIYFDIRFGFGLASSGANSAKVKNIRIKPAKFQGSDKATVKLIFDPTNYELNNIVTIYTLIREDGKWKIDDIAPKGDFKEGDENYDAALEHSDSIKTDMQNNYIAAMARYNKEQAQKGIAPK